MGAQDDKFCPLPWIHLGTHPHGGVTPCCISDMTAGKNRATIETVLIIGSSN